MLGFILGCAMLYMAGPDQLQTEFARSWPMYAFSAFLVLRAALQRATDRALRLKSRFIGKIVPLEELSMSNATNTVRLHACFVQTPERLYRAFLDPDAMAKWLPPHGFTGKVHQIDTRVGGGYPNVLHELQAQARAILSCSYTELKPH